MLLNIKIKCYTFIFNEKILDFRMSNSLKNDLQLLKELQILDSQIIEEEKGVSSIKNEINFLQEKVKACDDIVFEINRVNVENRISFDNIKNIVKEKGLNAEDFLNENDDVNACIDKIENLKSKFKNKILDLEGNLKDATEAYEKNFKDISYKKNGIISILKPNIVKIYDRLFALFDDKIVVTTVDDNTCNHCHVKICLQKYADILKFENIIYCENCGRILSVNQ